MSEEKESTYERKGVFKPEQILQFVVMPDELKKVKKGFKRGSPEFKSRTEREYKGQMIKMYSQRYQTFKETGSTCVRCGLKGAFFALETHRYNSGFKRYHFNLYGIDDDGKEILITKDHIIPKARGGKDQLSNYQTMCSVCNLEKGSKCLDRKLASIRQVKEIKSIEGADKIEIARVDGWQCVVGKGDFKPGDCGVYFEIDSYLPIEERYEFLRKFCWKKHPDFPDGGFRLKSARFLGCLSQGLLLPLDLFPEFKGSLIKVGDDVTEWLKIPLYEAPIHASLVGEVRGMRPSFVQRTSQERIQNLDHYFEELRDMAFEETEKLDGQSCTIYFNPDLVEEKRFGVCSRKLDILESDKNTFWRIVKALNLKAVMEGIGKAIAIQGEVIGHGIEKNRYAIPTNKHVLYIFDIFDIEKQRHMLHDERVLLAERLKQIAVGLEHVPVLKHGVRIFKHCKDIDQILEYAKSLSVLNPEIQREGVVFKSQEYIRDQVVSFKVINNEYLFKYGG